MSFHPTEGLRNITMLSLITFVLVVSLTEGAIETKSHSGSPPLKKEYDICNPDTVVYNPAAIYLPEPGSNTTLFVKLQEGYRQHDSKCVFVVKTCAECQVEIEVMEPHFDFTLCQQDFHNNRCPNFTFYDGDYRNQTTKTIRSYHNLGYYSSESQQLFIETSRYFGDAVNINKSNVSARFHVFSKKKYKVITGEGAFNGEFSSPFFPDPCIQNGEKYTYVIMSTQRTDIVTLTFDDWLLSPFAEFTFSGANLVGSVKGTHRRPYIIANGYRMEMTFYTGTYRTPGTHFSFPGFKATVAHYSSLSEVPKIRTDCGGIVDDSGGSIIKVGTSSDENWDCIWVISFKHFANGLHLSFRHSDYVDRDSKLEIREGITSEGRLRFVNAQMSRPMSLTSNYKGFYIRFRGRLNKGDSLVFAYSTFTFTFRCDNRYNRNYFRCNNNRCIDLSLRCDRFDHCGDNSDESSKTCGTGNSNSDDNDSTSAHVNVGIIVPLVVSVVVIIFFCLFLISLQKCYRLRFQRPARGPGRTGRENRPNLQARMSVTFTSGELPPSYNEAISNVNVAFSLTEGDEPTVMLPPPPSYGEAVEAVDFDLSTSMTRQGRGEQPSSGGVGSTVAANNENNRHTTTEPAAEPPPPYTANSSNHNNFLMPNNDNVSMPSVFPMTNTTNTLIARSFDQQDYVSSSSSSEDDHYEGRDDNVDDDAYPSDSSITDDDDGDSLYARAMVSVNSIDSLNVAAALYQPQAVVNNNDNNNDTTMVKSRGDSSSGVRTANSYRSSNEENRDRGESRDDQRMRAKERGVRYVEERVGEDRRELRDIGGGERREGRDTKDDEGRSWRPNRGRRDVNSHHRTSDSQYNYDDDYNRSMTDASPHTSCPGRGGREEGRNNGRAKGKIKTNSNNNSGYHQRRRSGDNHLSEMTSDNCYPDQVTRGAIDRRMPTNNNNNRIERDENENNEFSNAFSNSASHQSRDREDYRFKDDFSPTSMRHNRSNSDSTRGTNSSASVSSTTALVTANYLVSHEENEDGLPSSSLVTAAPLAQVVFKTTENEASFV